MPSASEIKSHNLFTSASDVVVLRDVISGEYLAAVSTETITFRGAPTTIRTRTCTTIDHAEQMPRARAQALIVRRCAQSSLAIETVSLASTTSAEETATSPASASVRRTARKATAAEPSSSAPRKPRGKRAPRETAAA